MTIRKPQPFFLQVSPPKSLYWPFTAPMGEAGHQECGDTRGHEQPPWHCCPHHCHPSPAPATTSVPLWAREGSPASPHSTGHPQQQEFCRCHRWVMRISSSAAPGQPGCPGTQHYTTSRPKPKKNCIFPKKSCYSRHSTWIAPHLSTHTLGLNMQLLQWLVPAGDRTLANTKRKIWFLETGSRNYPVPMTIWRVQVSLLLLISPVEFQGNRLTLGAEQDTEQRSKVSGLGPLGLGMVLNHRNQAF